LFEVAVDLGRFAQRPWWTTPGPVGWNNRRRVSWIDNSCWTQDQSGESWRDCHDSRGRRTRFRYSRARHMNYEGGDYRTHDETGTGDGSCCCISLVTCCCLERDCSLSSRVCEQVHNGFRDRYRNIHNSGRREGVIMFNDLRGCIHRNDRCWLSICRPFCSCAPKGDWRSRRPCRRPAG